MGMGLWILWLWITTDVLSKQQRKGKKMKREVKERLNKFCFLCFYLFIYLFIRFLYKIHHKDRELFSFDKSSTIIN